MGRTTYREIYRYLIPEMEELDFSRLGCETKNMSLHIILFLSHKGIPCNLRFLLFFFSFKKRWKIFLYSMQFLILSLYTIKYISYKILNAPVIYFLNSLLI